MAGRSGLNPGQRTPQGRAGASEPEDYIHVIEKMIDEMENLKNEVMSLKAAAARKEAGGAGGYPKNIAENKTSEKVP